MPDVNMGSNCFDFDMEMFLEELKEENKFLTELVDTIPAKMYFGQDIKKKITADKHSTMDKLAEGLKRKFSKEPELSAKSKHKRARLDPSCQKSISQIKQELGGKKEKKNKRSKGILVQSSSLTRAANVEELQKRLQERIEMLQLKRKACGSDPDKKKSIKNKLKKLKTKKHKNLNKVKEPDTKQKDNLPKDDASSSKMNSKPVFNKEGKTIFSKLDFSENGILDDSKKKKMGQTGKKYKKLLKIAEKKQEEMQNLKDTNPDKAELVIEKEKWKKAIQKSEGIKIKDDPNLLKKSLKRVEKQKKKSSKLWKERVEQTEVKKKTRQEKRTKNIQIRKQEKLDKKIKKAKKKGRVIPGF